MFSAVLALMVIMMATGSFQGGAGMLAVSAAESVFAIDCTPQANALVALGLLKGTGNGLELTRNATRAEAAMMLVRLLGKETEAATRAFTHPFTDVPDWADVNVGYLYANGLVKGIDATHFDSTGLATPNQYATFILRSMGYDDAKGDFKWNDAIRKGVSVGLFTSVEGSLLGSLGSLPRGALVLASYNSLYSNWKGTSDSLLRVLFIKIKSISAAQIAAACKIDTRLASFVKTSLPEASAIASPAVSFTSVDTLVINSTTFKKAEYVVKLKGNAPYLFVPLDRFKYAFKYPLSGDYNFPVAEESDGAVTMTWKDENQSTLLQVGMQIGSTMAIANGQPYDVNFGPYLLNSQVMMPINFFAEVLDMRTEVFAGRTYLQYSFNFPQILLEGSWTDIDTGTFTEFTDFTTNKVSLPTYASSYTFNADGTYHRGIISAGGFTDMLLLQDGKYRVIGNTIVYYDILETIYNGTPFVLKYKDKAKTDPEYEFIDNYNGDEEKIQLDGFWLHRPN
jgi:hypothetical protein